jgi:hypothetical protein
MRIGQRIRAQLIYPVYADNTLIIPAQTTVICTVVELRSNHVRRVNARLRLSFTPFRTPVVRFTGIALAEGSILPITTATATDGAPIYRLGVPSRRGGFIRRQWDSGPQKNTARTVETSEPLIIPPETIAHDLTPAPTTATTSPASECSKNSTIQAYLGEQLSSSTTKSGEEIKTTVGESIYNSDHTIAVTQRATMIGVVTQAKAARFFGRAGALHFDFKQLKRPTCTTQNVQTSLTEADADQKLALDSEVQVKPKPQDKFLVPLALLALASRPLDIDEGNGGSGAFGKDAVASNSLGVIGCIVGTAAQQRNIGAGRGYYGAAISINERWIKRGPDVTFARDTRLVLQCTPRNSTGLHPESVIPHSR